jgi:hypothetical protein
MTAYDENGNRVGTCDSNCYGAKGTSSAGCTCICRGANHGAGHELGIQNVQDLDGEWLKHGRIPEGVVRYEVDEQLLLMLDDPQPSCQNVT